MQYLHSWCSATCICENLYFCFLNASLLSQYGPISYSFFPNGSQFPSFPRAAVAINEGSMALQIPLHISHVSNWPCCDLITVHYLISRCSEHRMGSLFRVSLFFQPYSGPLVQGRWEFWTSKTPRLDTIMLCCVKEHSRRSTLCPLALGISCLFVLVNMSSRCFLNIYIFCNL